MCLLCQEARRLSSCREAGELVVLYFDGWPLIEAPKRLFKDARDFREFPIIFEKLLTDYRLPQFTRKDANLRNENKNK